MQQSEEISEASQEACATEGLSNKVIRKPKRHRVNGDPVIDAIHDRLDTLEELAEDIRQIKEWIATVVKVMKAMEFFGHTFSRIAVVIAKISFGCSLIWLSIQMGIHDLTTFVMNLLRGGK